MGAYCEWDGTHKSRLPVIGGGGGYNPPIPESDVTNLVSDLSGKASSSHTHTKSQITDFSHTHPESDITNLVSDLAGKASSSHNHAASDINSGVLAAARIPSLANGSAKPVNPTGTTSTSGVMSGSLATFTPNNTGTILVIVSGYGSTTGTDAGWKVDLRYGTGSAPANGASLSGTVIGVIVQCNNAASSTTTVTPNEAPFVVQGIVTGLTLGTQIWVECGQTAIANGTASLKNITVSIIEI